LLIQDNIYCQEPAMHQYTSSWISCWILSGPRLWLVLALVVSGVAALSVPTEVDQSAVWVWPDEAAHIGLEQRSSRIGRGVWRLGCVMWASRLCLTYRVGLMASWVAASGLAVRHPAVWHWLWLPVADWVLSVMGWLWPTLLISAGYQDLRGITHRAYQWSVMGLGLLVMQRWLNLGLTGMVLGNLVVSERDGSHVKLEAVTGPDGQLTYRVRLVGEFVYEVTPRDEFEKRFVILDLRRLRTPGREDSPWGIVRQEDLAQVFGVFQEHISRWQGYVRDGQWAQLLSVSDQSLLTDDLRQQIVAVWAMNLWQTATQVRERLGELGIAVTQRLVEEAGRQSGLMLIRERLKEQLVNGADGWRPRDGYLTQQLFQLIDRLQAQLDQGQTSPREEQVEVTVLRQRAGVSEREKCLEKPWPWLFQVEHWLWGAWSRVDDGTVRCPHCGSEQVAVKSKKPRRKAYLDEQGQRQTVAVYRYYCQNSACSYKTFTNLPPGLIAYSVWRLDARLKALELYLGLRTNYRSAANALGVAPSTLYHWLEQFGAEPLQVAAWFGLVRSSGVVGIDEKYVKVPKNDKPASKQRQWMYVYVAVDVHTLDLLHIAIFPNLGKDSARTFLLELRAKGYHPRVLVTDMNQDYTEPLGAVFPNAVHHECVFHALQYWHRCFKDAFGRDYEQTRPDMFQLRQQIDHTFQAKTRRTVETRYAELMARRDQLVQAEPDVVSIFDSLARHYPNLVNAYDSPLIPLTNNATERLIHRFDQHYQNFAGFDSIETARCYLHLFELTYRFTPFGPEVQPHLRGKCPLELAGYDLTQVPLSRYLREHGTTPLIPPRAEVVPK
jgi:transposase-like protein